ncbi:6425_t:CDS:2, partial [Dentiscutata heterogama]
MTSQKPSEESEWNNDIEKYTTQLIFHKGSESDFREMIWDLKYNKYKYTIEELKKIQQIHILDLDLLQFKDQQSEIDNNIEKEVSEPDSDDSEYTSQQKKR